MTTLIRNGDLISHTSHRHEPPVTAQDIGIVHEDEGMLVINKPAGVPVHPTGRYNYNSVTEILHAQRGPGFKAHPCNRLDRLTSGIMFLGKNMKAANAMAEALRVRNVRKEYVARVVGEFPDGDVVCEQPILNISPKLGLNRVRANGKDARTVFRKMAYYPPSDAENAAKDALEKDPVVDGMPWKRRRGYSIVRCMPLTGRTHQLRVHLQFLGHPIANDPIYANQRVFGQYLGRGDGDANNDEDIITRLSKMGKSEIADAVSYHEEMVDDYHKKRAERATGQNCEICQAPLYSDPGQHELGIYLHAKRYWCMDGGWEYETALPEWALPPAGMAGPTEATPESDPLAADLSKLGLEDKA
jgi:tRNA pseudouridine32 synthase